MANFSGSARSNYFRVKDEAEFKAWALDVGSLKVIQRDDMFGLYSEDTDSGCWPVVDIDSDGNYDEIFHSLHKHLADGAVCVLMEAGAEKLRYISGLAQAFDNSGKIVQVSLDDIYDKALKEFGVDPTTATY